MEGLVVKVGPNIEADDTSRRVAAPRGTFLIVGPRVGMSEAELEGLIDGWIVQRLGVAYVQKVVAELDGREEMRGDETERRPSALSQAA